MIANDTGTLSRTYSQSLDLTQYKGAGLTTHENGKALTVINSNALYLRDFKNKRFNQASGGAITHEMGHAFGLSDVEGADCKMGYTLDNNGLRIYDTGRPFCPSCENTIRQALLPHLAKTTVNLITQSISFENTPEGVTTYRDIVFEVTSAKEVNLAMTPPTGGFGTPYGLTNKVPPGNSFQPVKARLWLSYTATNAGDSANGTVTVSCPETGLVQETQNIMPQR